MFTLKPPTRISTLATLEEVSTTPETMSPACGVVGLICTQRICGAASGGNMRIVGVGIGEGDAEGAGERLGVTLAAGETLGAGVTDCAD
jgi:hypothetical protein